MKPTGTTIGTSTSKPNDSQSASTVHSSSHDAVTTAPRIARTLIATDTNGRRRTATPSAALVAAPATAAPMYVNGSMPEP